MSRPVKRAGPDHVHPLVRVLIDLVNAAGVSSTEICREAGYERSILSSWRRRGRSPNVSSLEDLFNVLGYTLRVVPIDEDSAAPKTKIGNRQEYLVTSPAGREERVLGMAEFCRREGLDQFEMYRIAGTSKTHKGWRADKY